MENYDLFIEINYNPNWPDHNYRILIVGGTGSGKTNVLLPTTRYWQNVFIRQRSIRIKVSIAY